MKFGFRTPNFKSMLKARTTGRVKRSLKRNLAPGYGKKGSGWVNNPKKAVYNAIYSRYTIGLNDFKFHFSKGSKSKTSSSVPHQQELLYFNKTRFMSCILGGWFGLHRYMRGQIGIGILYTLTIGCCCIGWFVDIIIEATRPKEQILNNNADPYIEQFKRELQILNESAVLMQETTNPETFFSRCKLYFEKLELLSRFDIPSVTYTGEDPLEKIAKKESLQESAIKSFIDRYWQSVLEHAYTLKTNIGRKNAFDKFLKTLNQYDPILPISCIEYYTQKYNDFFSVSA